MQNLKQFKTEELKNICLFGKNKLPSANLIPVLIDCQNRILAGSVSCEHKSLTWAFVLENAHAKLKDILAYQADFNHKKLSFQEKLRFYRNIQITYPEVSPNDILKNLEFPENKKTVFDYFCKLPASQFDSVLEKGINSLREAEYWYQLRNTKFPELLLESKLKGKNSRLALNMAFELLSIRPDENFAAFSPNNLENCLQKARYPEFHEHLKNYQKANAKLSLGKHIKVFTQPFFEGKKLTIRVEIKNTQQFEEFIKLIQKQKEELKKVIELI